MPPSVTNLTLSDQIPSRNVVNDFGLVYNTSLSWAIDVAVKRPSKYLQPCGLNGPLKRFSRRNL